MRKFIIGLVFCTLISLVGCRWAYSTVWRIPKWINGKILNVYTGNGHYDGKKRWDNFTRNFQQIENFADIYFFNYDIRDPFLGTPFFGDPR